MRTSAYDVLRLPPIVVDVAITIGIAVLVVALPAFAERQFGLFPLGSSVAYSFVLIAPLALRRVLPVISFALVSLACLVQLRVVPHPMWADAAFLVSLASIARYGPAWARWSGLVVGVFGAVAGPLQWINGISNIHQRRDLYPMLIVVFAVLSCWILGDLRRTRANYVAELEERNRRLAAERDQQVEIAAANERQRIAREMHDVVAHSLSVIVVQADGARYAADRDPQAAQRALETIGDTSRSALTDMRRLLGLLRDGEGTAGMAPQPGARDIDALVANVASSGLPVSFELVGQPYPVDEYRGLTLYRIVQEALTNIMKHGGPDASADVRLTYAAGSVTVCVADDGQGPAGWPGRDGIGQGLVGMRERVELHGGDLLTRARPGGGFEVVATLPAARVGAYDGR